MRVLQLYCTPTSTTVFVFVFRTLATWYWFKCWYKDHWNI